MIDQMIQDAKKRLQEYINRCAAQHLRRMRETAK